MMRSQTIKSIREIEQSKIDELKSILEIEIETYDYCFMNDAGVWEKIKLYKPSKNLSHYFESNVSDVDSKDKVFIMPNVILPKFKIKEYIKTFKATLTDDLDRASIIISDLNEKWNGSTSYYEDIIFLSLTCDFKGIVFNETDEKPSEFPFSFNDNTIIGGGSFNDISGYNVVNKYGITYSSCEFEDLYYPYTLNLIHAIVTQSKKVISSNVLHTNISKDLSLLNEETYEAIRSMLAANDQDTRNLGTELLCNCDVNYADFNLWRLSTNFNIERNRSNNLRFFLSSTDWNSLRYMSLEEILQRLESKTILTKDILLSVKDQLIENFRISISNYTEILEYEIKLPQRYLDILNIEDVVEVVEQVEEIETVTDNLEIIENEIN
jgi:hypothetical protein